MAEDNQRIMKTKSPSDLGNSIEKLLSAENPCQWKPICEVENVYEIDREIIGEKRFSFHNFVIDIINSYNEYEKENLTKALQIIEELENMISDMKNDDKDVFFNRIKEAVCHIVLTMKALMLMHSNKTEECFKISKMVTSVNHMDDSNRAAIHAIRSACQAMYSYEGTRTALSRINMAINGDSQMPYWKFLKATYLQKLRKLETPHDPPSLEERELFDKAVEKEPNPLFMVYLADANRETAISNMKRQEKFFWFLPDESAKNELKQKTEKMCVASRELYKKSYELKPRCPIIAFRCAFGLMMLPQQYQDVRQAKGILSDMMENHKTSGYGNFVYALYFEQFGKNKVLLKKYLDTAMELSVFNAYMNMIRIRFCEEGPKFDAVKELEDMRNKFKETPKQGMIIAQIISYYIFIKLDMKQACEYTIAYFKTQNHGNSLEVHRSCFIKSSESFSLIDVVTDQVKFTMSMKLTSEQRNFYNKFVHFMNFENIVVLKGVPQNLRRQILEGKTLKAEPWYHYPKARKNFQPKGAQFSNSNSNQAKKYNPKQQSPNVAGVPKPRPEQNVKPIPAQPPYHSKYQPGLRSASAGVHNKYQSGPGSAFTDTRNTYLANPRPMSSGIPKAKGPPEIQDKMKEFFEQFKPAQKAGSASHQIASDNRRCESQRSGYGRESHGKHRSVSVHSENDRRSKHGRSKRGRYHSRRDSFDGSEDKWRRRHRRHSRDRRHRRSRSSTSSYSDSDYDSRRRRRYSRDRHRRRSPSPTPSYSDSDYDSRRRSRDRLRRRSHSSTSDIHSDYYRRDRRDRGRSHRKHRTEYKSPHRRGSRRSYDRNEHERKLNRDDSVRRGYGKKSEGKARGKDKRKEDDPELTRKMRHMTLEHSPSANTDGKISKDDSSRLDTDRGGKSTKQNEAKLESEPFAEDTKMDRSAGRTTGTAEPKSSKQTADPKLRRQKVAKEKQDGRRDKRLSGRKERYELSSPDESEPDSRMSPRGLLSESEAERRERKRHKKSSGRKGRHELSSPDESEPDSRMSPRGRLSESEAERRKRRKDKKSNRGREERFKCSSPHKSDSESRMSRRATDKSPTADVDNKRSKWSKAKRNEKSEERDSHGSEREKLPTSEVELQSSKSSKTKSRDRKGNGDRAGDDDNFEPYVSSS